jgi:hypothetical protein
MQLSSDLEMRHPLWARADEELCSNNELGIFNRLVDVYVIACAIGIKEDAVIKDSEIDSPLSSPKTIGRNTHRENQDVRDLLDFMLQNALIQTKTLNISEDERLELAFNPDYDNKKIRAAEFLTGFANYGITKIFENMSSRSSLVAMEELYKYFESLSNAPYEDILKAITLEELNNL